MATDQNDSVTLALPAPGAGPQMRMVAVSSIVASLTNPRKVFKQEPLQELADSIKASGVHQPILLRPLPAARVAETSRAARTSAPAWPFATTNTGEPIEYELVAGERRWRACQLAGVGEIPAMIRDLTDAQTLEVQVIENLQREDVTPLEEAEGYEVLMRTSDLNADQVGAKIGKSRSYVYGRLKVLDLCEGGRAALRDGKIDFSRALLAARIPHDKLQLEAVKWMTDAGWDGEMPSYRECARHVQSAYMLELKSAIFSIKDAALLPDAGACTECSKRTGADRDLFADVKSADVCTDTKCFHAKAQAHTDRLAAAAREKGQTVIVGKEAEELFVGGGWAPKIKGYRRLDSAEDSPTGEPLRKIIGKQMKAEGIAPTKVENPRKRGELIDALPNDVALRLLKIVEGQATAAQQVTKEAKAFVDEKKAQLEAKARAKYEQGWRTALLVKTWEEMNPTDYGIKPAKPIFTLDVHRYFALRAVKSLDTDDAQAVAAVLGLDRVGAHAALIEYAKECINPDWLQLLCIMQIDSGKDDHSYGGRVPNEGLMLVAGKVFGDDLPGVIGKVQKDAAAKYLPKIEKAPAPTRASAAQDAASTPPPAAQASATRAKGKPTKAPAARGQASAPKATAAEASAAIAAGLAALEAEAPTSVTPAKAWPFPGDPPGGLVVGGYARAQGVYEKQKWTGETVRLMQFHAGPSPAWSAEVVSGKANPGVVYLPVEFLTALVSSRDHEQAPAAQGDESPAVPAGQPAAHAAPSAGDGVAAEAQDVAPTAQGDEGPSAQDGSRRRAHCSMHARPMMLPPPTRRPRLRMTHLASKPRNWASMCWCGCCPRPPERSRRPMWARSGAFCARLAARPGTSPSHAKSAECRCSWHSTSLNWRWCDGRPPRHATTSAHTRGQPGGGNAPRHTFDLLRSSPDHDAAEGGGVPAA
ncbi:ParB/RepB/Spo0J family partition protein [Paracidovorax cattleyae]|uniref:ParB/RepB/Spo0J family partition protein n=1 Tax=Paracidovorax cattleyae TaxID=80868 RepID=UPI001E3DD31F|nr:ParB/RepB/Spo0J family partition protein [Paracidovorax cattleyae]